MEKIEVTWKETFIVWWSFSWRVTVFSVIFTSSLLLIVAVILKMIERMDLFFTISEVLGYIISTLVSIGIMKKILNKKYKNFSVALVNEKDV